MSDSSVFYPSMAIRLFGPFEVCIDGRPLPRLRSRKGQWLLGLLVLHAGREVERIWLAGMLWPDSSEEQALANLRTSLKDLRRALGTEARRLRAPGDASRGASRILCLDLSGVEADLLAFDAAIARADEASLAEAVSLYRGPLLDGCIEAWAFQERESREQAFLDALEVLAAWALARGELATAERYLRRAAATDPLRETAQRALMQALAAAGNYAAALLVYRELRLRLHRELNAEPDPETRALFQQLQAEAREKAAMGRTRRDPASLCARRGGSDDEAMGQAGRSSHGHLAPLGGAASSSGPLSRLVAERSEGSEAATLTFLFTDIEGSTRLWEADPQAMRALLARHDHLLREAIEAHGGTVFKTMGDQFCAAFAAAPHAVVAALAAQRALHAEPWLLPSPLRGGNGERVDRLRVRMALHTGSVEEREGDCFGPPLNRVARLLDSGHGGQILLSLATAELIRDELPEGTDLRDLGERRLPDLIRPARIFQLVAPDLPADFPPLRSVEAFRHNLPLQLTRFIGREREITELQGLLGKTRLVTLTGAGGCGKTRLALQVAAELLAAYGDGVWFVDLAPLADPGLVAENVAAVLGLREGQGRSLIRALTEYLQPRQLLLLLDNCEHLLEGCGRLAGTLLQSCPHLQILATSREPLGLPGEIPYRVPSLSFPVVGPSGLVLDREQMASRSLTSDTPQLTTLLQYEAVSLFLDRATTVRPDFRPTDKNAWAVAQICARLDGIPLAIELAAARVRALAVEEIQQRLDDRFPFLTSGNRASVPRHQTLRALIDWSYDLLSEPERILLRRLSVFAGGFTLAAAEAVCADRNGTPASLASFAVPPPDAPEIALKPVASGASDPKAACEGSVLSRVAVLDALTSLVDKSLVHYEERGADGRYCLLETVRQYGCVRLRDAGEEAWVRQAHRDYFLALAERADAELWGSDQARWVERLESEHGNMRTALDWSKVRDEAEAGLRLGAALGRFWEVRGYFAEGRERLAAFLARRSPATPEEVRVRGRALHVAGTLAWLQGDAQTAQCQLEESLSIGRSLEDKALVAWSLRSLAAVATLQSDYGMKRSRLEESLALARASGEQQLVAICLSELGVGAIIQGERKIARVFLEESLALGRELGHKGSVAFQLMKLGEVAYDEGDLIVARARLEESLTLAQDLGQRRHSAMALQKLGQVALKEGNCADAQARLEDALALDRDLGEKREIGISLRVLGEVAQARGDYEAAHTYYQASLAEFRPLRHGWGIAWGLDRLAGLAAVRGETERAARVFGAAAALREAIGAPVPPVERPEIERAVAAARDTLGQAAFAAAWAEGRALSLEQACDLALQAGPDAAEDAP